MEELPSSYKSESQREFNITNIPTNVPIKQTIPQQNTNQFQQVLNYDIESQSNSFIKTSDSNQSIFCKIVQYKFVILFIIIILSNFIFCQTLFANHFTSKINQIAYRRVSFILFIIVSAFYIQLLFSNPSQTNYLQLSQTHPNRIFPSFLSKSYSNNCSKCNNIPKYNRSSHCDKCNQCILRRNHHCIFINKCIGYSNSRTYWFLLIWLVLFGIIYYQGLANYFFESESNNFALNLIIILSGSISLITFGFVCLLLLQQCISILNGATIHEIKKIKRIELYLLCFRIRKKGIVKFNKYNKGWVLNVWTMLAPTLVHMLIPLPKMVKNDIMETDYSFWKLKQLSQEEMIKEVCKIKKEKIEAVIEKKNEEDSPEKFMENCRKNYSDQNIL